MALTPKQEAFCFAYIENGGNASEAYRTAYDAKRMKPDGIHVNASKLLSSTNVALRIKELREASQKRHEMTVDDIVRELEEAREIAKTMQIPNAGAMVSASLGKAKVLGLIKEKVEHSGNVTTTLNVSFKRPNGH